MPFFTEPTEAECFEAEQELLFDVHFRQLDREIRKMIEQDKQKGAKTPNNKFKLITQKEENMEELFERYYDNPVDNDGNQKPNKSLGVFEIIETLESDFYNSMRIAKSADNKIYLVIERETSGYNGGTRLRLLEIKNLRLPTTRQEENNNKQTKE